MRTISLYFTMICLMLLSACGGPIVKPTGGDDLPTLGDLKPAYTGYKLKAKQAKVSIEELIERYNDVIKLSDDPDVVKTAVKRLAHLKAVQAEQQQSDSETSEQLLAAKQNYQQVAEKFEKLLEQYPNDSNNDEILYQLAKVFDLLGEGEKSLQTLKRLVQAYPDSPYRLEVEFRRGELLFSRSKWKLAQESYAYVVQNGQGSSFYLNAIYMHGWVLFKRNDYELALNDFIKVLDIKLGKEAKRKSKYDSLDDVTADLTQADVTLVDDTLRVMSIMFAYIDGGKSINELLSRVGGRHYANVLYQSLGELYISQQRYRDSAEAYKTYMAIYPHSEQTPLFQLRVIDAYTKGRFPSLILPEKRTLVEQFGVNSNAWAQYSEPLKQRLKPELKSHITELAGYYHTKAQALKKRYSKRPNQRQKNEIAKTFKDAGQWYAEYLDTFPDDEKQVEMTYLLAEAWYEAGLLLAAIRPYEDVAFKLNSPVKTAAEANYSIIIIYQQLLASLPEIPFKQDVSNEQRAAKIKNQKVVWKTRQLEAQEQFVARYKTDKRVLPLLLNIAQQRLAFKHFKQAAEKANMVLAWQPPPSPSQRLKALLVLGHSEFDLMRYQQAELSYYKALKLLGKKDQRRTKIRDRIAASIYKQGEMLVQNEQIEAGIIQFQRVAKVVPESSIRRNADFDAATYLLQLKQWSRAVKALNAFQRHYPKHPFSKDIPAKLVVAYQALKQWDKAAQQLAYIWRNDTDPLARRQALLLSAQLYQKSGKTKAAIDAYRSYAHRYPQPFDNALEASYELSELYKKNKDEPKRRYWLKKIIRMDARAGAQRSDRSRYLAAAASMVFADDKRWAFNRIKLKVPLSRSLKRKKTALEAALKAYQLTMDYGVETFATQSTYRIAEIYRRLSEDMMDSERPPGLSALELEQYELLLEEQAYPFEEKSIEIHIANSGRSWQGNYDNWVKASFKILRNLMPARFNKVENRVDISEYIY